MESDNNRSRQYAPAVRQLQSLIETDQAARERDLVRSYLSYATLPSTAQRLYRLAVEKQKPDAEREPGYQQRDLTRFRQSMQAISRRYDETVDKAILSYLLGRYAELPEQYRSQALDSFYQIGTQIDQGQVDQIIQDSYAQSSLNDDDVRLAWLDKSVEDFHNSDDPLIQYAVASHEERMVLEQADKELSGQFQRWRPQYMEAVIDYNRSLGRPIYADANSSLRVTIGQVQGNRPKDGLVNQPFTSLEGILGKDTGVDPFNAPSRQLDLIRAKQYGHYALPSLGTVPVN
ncbi:MAG: S46 family peptidase, partial [Gammaproteobacteria bacterium]|nr:S46 family peptidase [Gammaproteobacteria bacterium]